MSDHSLSGRSAAELSWFQRREVLQAAAAWTTMGGFGAALAQERSNVVQQQGDALLNGKRLLSGQSVQTGDELQTGPGSAMVFVIGSSSFLVRENTFMKVERGRTQFTVSLLRLLTGAVASVWGKGNNRAIITPTLTAGIRGTGVYTEVLAEQDNRSYFCNCYGTVQLDVPGSRTVSKADYHQSFWSEAGADNTRRLTPATAINHTDEEIEFLAGLVRQRTAWQIAGRKGSRDGKGAMYAY